MRKLLFIFIAAGFCFSSQPVSAQTDIEFYDYPQNHLDWFTIESENFLIHFQEGNSRSAQVVSRVAEEIYGPITSLYEYTPDEKVSIVLKDREDYSNGAAYFFDNKIDIWLPALDTPLRGTHNWLRNVIAHEYVHIIQIQKAMKRGRKIPAFYLQWLAYEDVRRPDVLYGFPNGIVTAPFATVNVPAWLAEGTAQYQTAGLLYETWDSHRDMILRTRILNDTYFSLNEMGSFTSKTSLERETVYNQGYAFVIYLASRFGDDVLREISEALGTRGVYRVSEAIEMATGVNGYEVFDDWIAERKAFYADAVAPITPTETDTVEPLGFYNFYPQLSPDQSKLAYLSNKFLDFGLLSLYLVDANGDSTEVAVVDDMQYRSSHNHATSFEPKITFLETTFSFSPDGNQIAYAINKKNKYGEHYRDIFLYDIDKDESTRLTNSARIQSPAWSNGGEQIAAIQFNEGTQNLVILNPDQPDSVTQLTDYGHGETIFTPAWSKDDSKIYFASASLTNRNIYIYDIESGEINALLEDEYIDYRDPRMGPDGKYLYYSSNPDGIFNIYRMNLESGDTQKLTSVLGGAFMPYIGDNGLLYYSEYQKGGYKIKSSTLDELLAQNTSGSYSPNIPEGYQNTSEEMAKIEELNDFDDADIEPFDEKAMAVADTGNYYFDLETKGSPDQRRFSEYTDTYSGFSIFPVLRFDNYTKKNGSNGTLIKNGDIGGLGENLLRDVKPGLYFSSRDVIDKLSLFGGLMVGVGSQPAESIGGFFRPDRLIGLDRDAFLIVEHRGLPFIERSWSPTVALELYNMTRNVSNGLTIEEFPCTSCLPDTVNTDIKYDIWEAGLFLRSKLSRRSMLELGVTYSPYRVSTENFYSRELKQDVPGESSQYFRGTTFSAAYNFDYYMYSNDADIAPLGLKGYVRYQYQPSKLLEEYEIKEGTLSPVYKTSNNHSAEIHMRYGFKTFGNQSFQARIRGFNYFNSPGDSFYSDYVGGFLGMRSYPYFALAGSTTGFTSLSWFTPIFRNINKQAGPYTIDKLFARFFFETGNGWRSPYETGNNLKSGIGAELRLAVNGFYLFPLKLFVSGSYGLNRFTLTLPDEYITNSQDNKVTYGREILFHFGITFDFELL
ncbi:PD40 domain-containing protein [Gracilimonas mengyeensis]|uniref:WD40-like Beta Propeller Repeat n=1 Tax=Gracilimonas mengyeensis TaxID=1302730 RepID=A0A521FFW3_9BACT|nr:PD40 domain-containing protein [Gracilimonas mengyeensis]SMO94874.1 WD40-like Beta Propeller Repeat [Gracilimonas mengyeensis]